MLASAPFLIFSSEGQGTKNCPVLGFRNCTHDSGREFVAVAVAVVVVCVFCAVCVVAGVALSISIAEPDCVCVCWVSLSTPFGTVTGVDVPFVCVSDLLSLGVAFPVSASALAGVGLGSRVWGGSVNLLIWRA